MLENGRSLSKYMFEVMAVGWLCMEMGQFVETHASWAQADLFWPFWACFSLAAIFAIKLLEIHLRTRKQNSS